MVLAYRITLLAMLIHWGPIAVYAQAITDETLIKGKKLQIIQSNLKCQIGLAEQSAKLSLALTAPCRFMRYTDKTTGNYTYPKIGTVILIVGAPAPKAYMKRFESHHITEADLCSDQAQGIILKGETLTLTKKLENWLYCPNLGKDEKLYFGLVHP